MEREISRIVKSYKKDTNYIKYLENTIKELTTIYNEINKSDVIQENDVFYKNVCEIIDKIAFSKENYECLRIEGLILSEKEKEVLKIFFKSVSKKSVSYEKDEIYWSNGHDDGFNVDLNIYKVLYCINGEEIIFNIESEDQTTTVNRASIKIGDCFEYILCDHGDELGYYDNGNRREITLFDIKKMKSFYEKTKMETNFPTFYSWLILLLTEELLSDINYDLDDPLRFEGIKKEIKKTEKIHKKLLKIH